MSEQISEYMFRFLFLTIFGIFVLGALVLLQVVNNLIDKLFKKAEMKVTIKYFNNEHGLGKGVTVDGATVFLYRRYIVSGNEIPFLKKGDVIFGDFEYIGKDFLSIRKATTESKC